MIRPWSHSSWNKWLPLEGKRVFEGDGCTVITLVRESEWFNSHIDSGSLEIAQFVLLVLVFDILTLPMAM